jgi:hypothetical protein
MLHDRLLKNYFFEIVRANWRKGKCLKLLQFRKRFVQRTLKLLIHFKFLPGIKPNSTLFATVFEKIYQVIIYSKSVPRIFPSNRKLCYQKNLSECFTFLKHVSHVRV